MQNYVDIAYDQKEKPVTSYPDELANYLCKRFSLQPGMKILDNGCGRGDFLEAFVKLGLDAYGTDIVQGCEAAQLVDFNHDILPFPDETFDVVFSKSVIEHIENQEHYMMEMRRVLKKEGLLMILVPDWKTQHIIFYEDPTHIHPYTQKSLDRLLNMMGFRDVNSEEFIQLPQVWKYPVLRIVCYMFQLLGPVKRVYNNKFFRFSRELMILGTGRK